MPRFKEMPMHPGQVLLFSQSVDEALSDDSDARSFGEVMECLSYRDIENKCSERGCPPYPPKVMVKILGYAYSKGIRSSRRIEELLKVDVRFMWLSGGLRPDHNTIARFRKENWRELESVFKDSVRVCCEAGLVYLSVVATDGTKIEAAASKRRAYSKSMLERQLASVDKILREAEEVDASEDELYGSGTGGEIPEGLRDARVRKAKLEEIAKRLTDSKKTAVVETDPDSRVMKTGKGKRPAYNLQLSVDGQSQVIVALKLTQSENDSGQLPGMVENVESNTGLTPDVSLVDKGYVSESTLMWVDERHNVLMPIKEHPQEAARDDGFASKNFVSDEGKDVLICPAGKELVFTGQVRCQSGTYRRYAAKGCQECSSYRECVRGGSGSRRIKVSIVEAKRKQMRERLGSAEGKDLYEQRKQTVEPVIGQMKSNRGLERFICWGLSGAGAESALMGIAHNVSKCAAKATRWAHAQTDRFGITLKQWSRRSSGRCQVTRPARVAGF